MTADGASFGACPSSLLSYCYCLQIQQQLRQVGGVAGKIQFIRGHCQDRTQAKRCAPFVIEPVDAGHVLQWDGALVVPRPLLNASGQGIQGRLQVDDQVGRGQKSRKSRVEVTVGYVVPLLHLAHLVEIAGENLRSFVERAILHGRGGVIDQFPVLAQATAQKENLGMKTPAAHIAVEVGQIGVVIRRFIERSPAQFLAEQTGEGGLAHADITCNGDEVKFHPAIIPKGNRMASGRGPHFPISRRFRHPMRRIKNRPIPPRQR